MYQRMVSKVQLVHSCPMFPIIRAILRVHISPRIESHVFLVHWLNELIMYEERDRYDACVVAVPLIFLVNTQVVYMRLTSISNPGHETLTFNFSEP